MDLDLLLNHPPAKRPRPDESWDSRRNAFEEGAKRHHLLPGSSPTTQELSPLDCVSASACSRPLDVPAPTLAPDLHHGSASQSFHSQWTSTKARSFADPLSPHNWVDEVSVHGGDRRHNVCFGTILSISARCQWPDSGEFPLSPFPVQLNSSDRFSATNSTAVHGRISSEHGQMIHELRDYDALDLYWSCTVDDDQGASRKPSQRPRHLPCTLEMTLYGPSDLFEDIGSWFEAYEVYLQDPKECHVDAPYWNPHRLSLDDFGSCPCVSQVVSKSSRLVLQDITENLGMLDIFSSNIDLAETPQPPIIRASLKRHQKQALTFMLRRELGWAFDDEHPDIWEAVDRDEGSVFINRVSLAQQDEEPPPFHGGIIADPMGLGKTLSMIALVANDVCTNTKSLGIVPGFVEDDGHHVSATLIVVPPPLLDTWEEQLSEHVVRGGLECRRHHGKTKLLNIREVIEANLVLTTYHTVSAEWRTDNCPGSSVLFTVRWRRIILDEAHMIRNGSSRMARAICALDSASRWAVTGTPIQNRCSDLASLLKFLQAAPYSDRRHFDADISRLWKEGEAEEAVKRLKRLSACLVLRRDKETINLPPRRDMHCPVDFSKEERRLYDHMRQQTITNLDKALLQSDLESSATGLYVNVLQQIESLRLVCNLGLHYHARHDNLLQSSLQLNDWLRVAQHVFDVQREMGSMTCLQCSSAPELTEALLDDAARARHEAQLSRCLQFVCEDCVQKLGEVGHVVGCSHTPSCPMAPVSTNSRALDEMLDLANARTTTPAIGLPSKIKALVENLKTLPADVKCVVFSTWRLTLDMIEAGLEQASIRCVRFDGKVPQRERQPVVNKFRTDPSLRVMLLTLSCGAVGLTLTVASRAYIMEPHWNPTLEEQALARIHRMGQTRDVTTVRFYVRDSFEQQVMETQESKKQLSGLFLSPHEGRDTEDNLSRLHRLRSLL